LFKAKAKEKLGGEFGKWRKMNLSVLQQKRNYSRPNRPKKGRTSKWF